MLQRMCKNPALHAKISEMRLPLSPLVRITTGEVHASFPSTLLHYWLLTESELDGLAAFYHQSEQSEWTSQYPKMMGWRNGLTIEEKRRKWGKFIGLRGCDTPVESKLRLKTEQQIYEEAREDEMMRRKREWYY